MQLAGTISMMLFSPSKDNIFGVVWPLNQLMIARAG